MNRLVHLSRGEGGREGEWVRGSAYPTSLTVEEVTIYIDESRLPNLKKALLV